MNKMTLASMAALALLACAHSEELPQGARYVNMGSSFAAGSGTGPAATNSVQRCRQSAVNYARLLAERLNLSLEDVSCGGATSAHLIGPWNELPPQIEAVTPATRLVTITIGGNDLSLVANLMAASCEQGESIRAGSAVFPCFSSRPVAEDAYAQLENNLRETARQIALRAPHARTIFIQYVTLVPQVQCANSRLSEAEAANLRAVASRLAAITAQAARESGATVLRVDEMSRNHTPCDADPWSVGFPTNYNESQGAPWHPNRRGMAVIASQLETMLSH